MSLLICLQAPLCPPKQPRRGQSSPAPHSPKGTPTGAERGAGPVLLQSHPPLELSQSITRSCHSQHPAQGSLRSPSAPELRLFEQIKCRRDVQVLLRLTTGSHWKPSLSTHPKALRFYSSLLPPECHLLGRRTKS